VYPSFEAPTDGDSYIEGGGGDDVVFGNLGQNDIVGGSSSFFSLTGAFLRPDGSNLLFGGAGTRIDRNHLVSESDEDIFEQRHARNASVIVGNNGDIVRIVGLHGNDERALDAATHAGGGDSGRGRAHRPVQPAVPVRRLDLTGLGYSLLHPIVVRGVHLLDYTPVARTVTRPCSHTRATMPTPTVPTSTSGPSYGLGGDVCGSGCRTRTATGSGSVTSARATRSTASPATTRSTAAAATA
jgi:hypothetical protein